MSDNFWMLKLATAKEMIEKQAKEIAKLKREVAKLRKASQWQPIETAPDGKVLLYYPEESGKNALSEWTIIGFGRAKTFRQPTHWLPLPKPPAIEGGE